MDRYFEFATNHWLLVVGLIVVTFLLIQDLLESAFSKFKSASPLEAVARMNNDKAVIVDVREPADYVKGHIQESINLPYGKLEERIQELEKFKESPLIVVCQMGSVSTPACKKLTKLGFANVFHLKGGIQAWEDNNLPIKRGKEK